MTGKGFYQALFDATDTDTVPWEMLSQDIRDIYTCAASIVQQQEIQPVQMLLSECMTMLNGALPPCIDLAETQAWCAKRDDLDAQVKAVIGKEVN